MLSRQNFTIGCLSLSATILLVGVFVLGAIETQRAEASGMIHSVGGQILLTGHINQTNELVYLIDSKTDQLLIYRLNETDRKLHRIQAVPLDDSKSKPGQKRLQP